LERIVQQMHNIDGGTGSINYDSATRHTVFLAFGARILLSGRL
jgi:hypothetical protein